MKLYATKKELYDTCMKSEAGITVIAVPVYSEDDGEFLGYEKKYVDWLSTNYSDYIGKLK